MTLVLAKYLQIIRLTANNGDCYFPRKKAGMSYLLSSDGSVGVEEDSDCVTGSALDSLGSMV